MPTFVTDNGVLYSGAKAKRIAIERGSKQFDTRIEHVSWQEGYRLRVDGKRYSVVRHRTAGGSWQWWYQVHAITSTRNIWCEPDGKIAQRVVAELVKLIEV